MSFGPGDEDRHPPGPDPAWTETWVFDLFAPDGSVGAFTWLTLQPNQRRVWYWSVVVQAGRRQLHVADVAAPLPSAGLRVRTTGLWAEHVCEVPFEQWTVQNECYAVALDDPADALGRAYGESTPVAVDMEWYGEAPAAPIPGGYRQAGEAHAVIELAGGPLPFVGPAARAHTWGALPDDGTVPAGVAAYLPVGDMVVTRVLAADGWSTALTPRP
ncbi:MAG TPA: hypothetical protein VGF22_15505 [Acidimicrobiales bacterium]